MNKNGELLAKLEQKVLSNNDRNNVGGQPDTKVQLSVDIPSKGIHKQASYSSDDEPPRKRESKYREYDKTNYVSIVLLLRSALNGDVRDRGENRFLYFY